MRKKFAAVLLAVFVFCSACIGTAFAATTTNGLEVDLEITSELGSVVYLVKVGDTSIYLEAESGGKFWIQQTPLQLPCVPWWMPMAMNWVRWNLPTV